MEAREQVLHKHHPLKGDYFIEEVYLSHSRKTDYWMGRGRSDKRTYLGEELETAKKTAYNLIRLESNKP